MSILLNNTVHYTLGDIISMKEFHSNESMWFHTLICIHLHNNEIWTRNILLLCEGLFEHFFTLEDTY